MLYVVGTPIGNLQDLSIRQAKTILQSEYILSEDTRSTGMLIPKLRELFPHIEAPTAPQLISYYKDNEYEKLPEILPLIESGVQVAMISQAGMPLISDPGYLLITHLIKRGIRYEVIPGPTAEATALVHSGFNPGHHMFIGFLSKRRSEMVKTLDQLVRIHDVDRDCIFVAYESPNRIHKTLGILHETIPTADIVVCRELTKMYEEVRRGTAEELMKHEYRGEITMVIRLVTG